MDRLLLTYEHVNGYCTYAWFETIDDVRYFASNSTEIKSIIEDVETSWETVEIYDERNILAKNKNGELKRFLIE